MNIAIFTNNYLPNPYGVSMSIESFRKEFEKMGHRVYIFAPEYPKFLDENPNVFRYPSIDFKYKISFPLAIPLSNRIDKILENLQIDVIHSQHPNLLGWQAQRWAKKKNVPLIFTWHTLYDYYAHFVPIIPKNFASWWAISNAVRYANIADQIIVPTPSVKNILEKWGVTNSNIEAIATGVDESFYQNADREKIREKYKIKKDEILILLVSRLTAEKNIKFLFEAVMSLLKKNPNAKFLVVGDGHEKDQLEKKAFDCSLNDKVFFAGVVAADKIKNYYAAADFFVHSSKSETQGMILTEAMYMGLPIVAVQASGAKDLIRNNQTGFLVKENADEFEIAAHKLIIDEKLRQQFSQAAKEIAKQNYTSSVCAKDMLDVYKKAIAK